MRRDLHRSRGTRSLLRWPARDTVFGRIRRSAIVWPDWPRHGPRDHLRSPTDGRAQDREMDFPASETARASYPLPRSRRLRAMPAHGGSRADGVCRARDAAFRLPREARQAVAGLDSETPRSIDAE